MTFKHISIIMHFNKLIILRVESKFSGLKRKLGVIENMTSITTSFTSISCVYEKLRGKGLKTTYTNRERRTHSLYILPYIIC